MAIQVNSPNNRTYVFSGSIKITPQSPLYNEARNQIINTLREIKRSNGVVLVGDATGIDALVASEAARMGVPYSVMGTGQNPRQGNQEEFGQLTKGFNVPSAPYISTNDTSNLSGYKRRDLEMVSQADVVIGIWNGSSTGTKDTFDAAVRGGKNAYLFNIEKGTVDTKSGDSFESGISLYDFWNKKSNQLIANNNARNRVTSREYWEGVDDASGINSPKSAFQKANFAQPDRFETTISNLNEVFSIINDRFKDPFMVQEEIPETAFVGQMRRVAFDQKYDSAWNSIGGFTNPLNSTQQLKWQNGGSGTFRDMVDQLASEAQKSGGSFSYAVRTDNYGSYLETVFTTYSNNRFYQNIRYNAEEGVWMSNTGTSNERVHTSRFTKNQSGDVEYQDIGYSLFQTLSPSAKDKNFVNGFTLPNYDRAQTFIERSRRMILGASLSEDLSVQDLFDVYETHDTFISRAQEAGVRADTPFGNLEFLKGKANSFNPPSLVDVSRRTAGTSATTEKDSVRRWRDKAIGLISFNGEIPELEWRSKVLFGSEVPMTGTVLKTASVFDPLSFGEGMGYIVGSPKLIENMEIPITPDAPIRNRVNFKNMKPGFLEINTPLGAGDINRDLGTNFRSGQFFVHGIFNRGLNDTISSSAMAMTVFSPGWQGEYKSSAYSKNQAVPLDRRSSLARITDAQLITMSPIKAHRFVDETIDVWRQNSDDTYNQMLDAAVKSGDYKTRAEAERAMYEDSKDGLVELVSSPDGKSQIPRFARESQWQYYSALASADWRRGQLQFKDINAPVQSARVDILLEEVGKAYGIDLSYERILKEDIKYADLPDGAKDLLRDYGIKGFSSAPTKGVKFKREIVFDTSDRVTRAQRVTANNSFNITELDIDVLESQQPEVAKLLKEMYGDSEEKRIQNYHAAKVGQTLDLRNRSSDEYVHFIKSGGAEIDMSDLNTVRELNKLITLVQEQTTNPLEIKTSEEDRVNNLRKGSGVGYGFNPGDVSPRYGAALVDELRKVYKTSLIAVHRGDGRSTVLDLNKLSGKESVIAQLSGMIRNGGSTNLSVPEYDDEEDPVSNIGRIKVSGIATRAASASIPAGVVIIHEDAAIRSIMNMPISEEKKNQMIADLKNGVPLEGIVRVQNFDRIAGFDNQAVYTYEQAIKLWPEARKDIVTSSNPVRVSELVPVKGSKDMDGDNLQITFTSRRHSTADQHWTERQLGTPYGEGVLEQSVGGEMQDIKKKTLGMLDSSESGHGRNLRALLDPYSDENKLFFKKALETVSGAGKSLREKFYANILMGYAYTSGTIVMSGMAQSDADSGRDIFSENQRFSMMHLPTDWYQKSMDLKPLENRGILSILGIRSLARRNNDGNWINPKQWKGDLTPDSKLLSQADFSDALLRSFIETSSGENSKDVSMSDEYNSQIGKSSLSRELAYLLMDKNTSEETFAQLTSLLNNKDVSAAFDLIKKSSPDWISGKSPLARYAMNMVYASQTLRGDTPVGALDDEVFGVYMNLLSRGIKKGDNISNFALVEALRRAEGMDEYKDSAFVGVLRKLAITNEDRETAKETKPYSYEKLVEWAEGVGDDDNAVKRAIKATISAFKRFSDGGFTGVGGKFDFAGIVHKGEYVITKEKVNHIRAGGGDAVMKEIAKELGATAFMSGAGSYWGGGYVGYSGGGIAGQGLYQGAYPLPRAGQVDENFARQARTPQATVQGMSVPRGQGIVVNRSVKGMDGGTVTYQEVMTPLEIEEYAQKRMSQVDTGRAFQGAQYLEDVSRGSLPFADFSLVTDEELLSRQWGAASSAVAGLTKKGRATGKLAATRQAAHGGQRMSDLDWAFSVMAKYGEVTSPEQWSALSESEQIMIREAVGIAHEVESSTTQAMQAGKLDARTARNMSQVVMTPSGASVSTRNVELGAFDEMFKNLGVSALSPVAAYEAQIGAQAKLTKEGALDAQSISQTVTGLQAMNKNLSDMSALLPKVNDGHKMYVKQAEESLAIFRQAEQQINALTKPGAVLNTEQQTTLALLRDKSVLGGQSIEDYVKANKSTFDDMENRVLQRRMSDALKQPYADTTPEERSDMLTQLLMGAGSRAGKARLAKERSIGLGNMVDDEGGLSIMGGLINLKGEGAQDAYGKFLRGFNAMNNASTVWAMRSISSMIINPALESAAAYEQAAASAGRSMYSEGLISYDDLMGGSFGKMIGRQQRREAGQLAYGKSVYGAYAPLMDMFISPEAAQSPLGLGAAIGVPAIGAGLIAQSVMGKAGMGVISRAIPLVGGLPVGAVFAGALGAYGLAATMGEASTDIAAMADPNSFYGGLGRFGAGLKTGIAELGFAPNASWMTSRNLSAASGDIVRLAPQIASGQISMQQALDTRVLTGDQKSAIETLFGVSTSQLVENAINGNVNSRSSAISFMNQNPDILNRLASVLGVDTSSPNLAEAVFSSLESGSTTIAGAGATASTFGFEGARQWSLDVGLPWEKDNMQSNFALYSAFNSRGLIFERGTNNYNLVSKTAQQMVAAGMDPSKILSTISSSFSPADLARGGSAFLSFARESSRLMDVNGMNLPFAAATNQAAMSQSAYEQGINQQRILGSSTNPFSVSQLTDMSLSFSPEYSNQANTDLYGFEFNRSLLGGSTSGITSLYRGAISSGDMRMRSILESAPSFFSSARQASSRDGFDQFYAADAQFGMETAWANMASYYGKDDAGLREASSYYGFFDTAGMSPGDIGKVITDFSENLVEATDNLVSFSDGFKNWLGITGQSFSNLDEGKALFSQFYNLVGGNQMTPERIQPYTGIAGATQAAYAGLSRTTLGMGSYDFSSIRDEKTAQAMLGIASTASGASGRITTQASAYMQSMTEAMDMIRDNPELSQQVAQGFSQTTFGYMQGENAAAFGFTPSAQLPVDLKNMSPAQFSVYQAASNGNQMAQAILLGNSPRFSNMTSIIGNTQNPALVGQQRFQFGFQQPTVTNTGALASPGDAAAVAGFFSSIGASGNQWFPGGTSQANIQEFMNQNPQGIFGMQNAASWANYQASMASYSMGTLGRRIDMAMTAGGAQLDPTTGFAIGGSNAGAAKLYQRMGMTFLPGNGMTYWQLEDAQVGIQRERQQFGLQQQGQSLALSWEQFALTGRQYGENEAMNYRKLAQSDRQFKESMALRREQFEYGVGYTQQEMTIGRGIQQTQEQWRGEDLAYNRNMMEVQFGFQMRDYNRNIRYARGRERLDMMRQRDDATVLYSMQAGQADRQETRHKTEMEWSADKFKREEENFKKTTNFQRQEFALQEKHHKEQMKFSEDELKLQRKHFEESRELEKKRLDMQGEAYAREVAWLTEVWALEDQRRLMDREHYVIQQKMQQSVADATAGAATKTFFLNLAMTALGAVSTFLQGQLNLMAFTDMPEINTQLAQGVDNMRLIANIVATMFPGTPPGVFTGGFMSDVGLVPQMADGGPTPPGLTMQSTGLVGLHAGEYVVPQKGTLAIRGDNPETIALLKEIRDELVELRKMGPGRVNAQIYTNEKSLDTGMLVNAAYTTRKQ